MRNMTKEEQKNWVLTHKDFNDCREAALKAATTQSIFTNEHGERDKGGRIRCSVCDYMGGIRISKCRGGKMPAGSEYTRDSSKWTDRYTCPICGSTERHYIYTGLIIEQIIRPVATKEAVNVE